MSTQSLPRAKHSSEDSYGQPFRGHAVGSASDVTSSSLTARYGAAALKEGFTALPTLLIRHPETVGITAAELRCVEVLCSYWWDARLPHPSIACIAAAMRRCERQVQACLCSLRRKGLLTITPRIGDHGTQITNEYDLHPLFAHLAAAVPESDQQRDNSSFPLGPARAPLVAERPSAAPPPPRPAAPSPRSPLHPIKNQLEKNDLGFGSVPLTPTEALTEQDDERGTATAEAPQTADTLPAGLCEAIGTLSLELGDAAPMASRTRVARLLRVVPTPEPVALTLLGKAEAITISRKASITARLADGTRNCLPYLLAVFERLLRKHGSAQDTLPATRPPAVASLPAPVHDTGEETGSEPAADAPPVWRRVLEQMSETLPHAMVRQQLLPLRAEHQPEGVLRLLAPSPGAARWLDRMLRRRIEDTLADLGHGAVPLQIETDVDVCRLVAS